MPQGVANSFVTPNYTGVLYMKGNGDTPLLSLLGNKRRVVNAVKFALGQSYSLAEPKLHNISEVQSWDAPEPTFAQRSGGFNVTQAFHKTFGVSDMKRSNMGTLAGINIAGQQPNPVDEKTFQSTVATRELARDVEFTLINSKFHEATSDNEANQTRGLDEAIVSNVLDLGGGYISYWALFDLLMKMRKQGVNTQGLVLWSDPIVRAQLMVEAAEDTSCKIVEGTQLGLNVTTLYTPAGSIVIHEGQFLPIGTAYLLNLNLLEAVEMNVPGKGNFYVEELPRTGAGTKWQIFGQMGLDYGVEWAHAKIVGVSPEYRRPRGKKVFMDGTVETAEVSPSLNAVTLSENPVVGEATAELALDWIGEPVDPTLEYQWYIGTSTLATFTAIEGATGETYTPAEADAGKYIKVQVKASGTATGIQMSNAKLVKAAE